VAWPGLNHRQKGQNMDLRSFDIFFEIVMVLKYFAFLFFLRSQLSKFANFTMLLPTTVDRLQIASFITGRTLGRPIGNVFNRQGRQLF
jgi:hypothetical protein